MRCRKPISRLELELHERAIQSAGFEDFGDPMYRDGLRALLYALDHDLNLTDSGWDLMFELVLDLLVARLYAHSGWSDHPDVLETPINRPLIITGLPRTGTTALHRLLALDPQFQGLATWLARRPMLRPNRNDWEKETSYREAHEIYEHLHSEHPDSFATHDITAVDVEECGEIIRQSFVYIAWAHEMPTYACWFLSQNSSDAYRYYANVLRLIGARSIGSRWLLKDPQHLAQTTSLLNTFPDACIIQTHRDPLESIPSFCSYLYKSARVFEGDAASPEALGRRESLFWRGALDSMSVTRQNTARSNFFDVDHRQFCTDPLGTIKSIYEYFGLIFDLVTEKRMHDWLLAQSTHPRSQHRYSLEGWGISSLQIKELFADYRAQHNF